MRTIILGLACLCCGQVFAQEKSTGTVIPIRDSIANLGKPSARKEAVKELRKAGSPAFKGLRSLAKNTGKGRDERIAAVLLAGEMVKVSTAATALDREGFRKDAEAMLSGDKDDFVREAAAITLGKLEDKTALKSLKSALNDRSGNVRMRAAWALAKNGDYAGKELALGGLKSKSVTEQILAIDVLAETNDDSLVEKIKDNFKSTNVWTRINSALAIKRIELKKIQGFGRIDYLEAALNDTQTEVRQWAVQELAKEIQKGGPNKDWSLSALKKAEDTKNSPASYYSGKILRGLVKEGKIKEEELQK